MKKGFTLVEMSIVLLIIALIIGGILVGRSMMSTARTQSVISDWQKYSNAANGYFTKYGYWPGDDYERANRWSGVSSNGNGDGMLGDMSANINEFYYFWQDLSLANYITGSYAGGVGNVPRAQVPNSYISHWYDSSLPANQALYLTGSAAVGTSGTEGTTILSGPDAISIDIKIDDGSFTLPTGTVRGVPADPAGCTPSVTTKSCNLYYIYKR